MAFQKRFLLYSAIFHIALAAAVFFMKPRHIFVPEKIEIEVKETVAMNSAAVAGSHHSGRAKKSQNFFLPKYQIDTGIAFSNDRDSYLSHPGKDNVFSSWGSGAGTFERISEYGLYQELYRNADGYLSYPGVLARNKIQGTVNARVVLEEKGNCDWKRTKIQGHNAYLELYVLDLLKKVCSSNYKKFTRDRLLTNIDLSFQFDINENNELERIEKQKLIVGNTLMFYRNSHQSITEWELGPFKGIFPIPTVYLNIPWIQENWDRLVNNKDPMSEFKKHFGGS
jgi:hypothetical protein